jgi:hypothetical protein
MSEIEKPEICVHCKRGLVRERNEGLKFHQWTDKGYVFCRVTIPMGVCDNCGSRSWDDEAEAMIEEAVRQAYDTLP